MYMCPVCGYKNLKKPPKNHVICPSCGTQFGYSDVGPESKAIRYAGLREYWIKNGKRWHSTVIQPPLYWNADQQLIDAHLTFSSTAPKIRVTFRTSQTAIGELVPA